MLLSTLRTKVSDSALNWRNIDALVMQVNFELAWNRMDTGQRNKVIELIDALEVEALRRMIRTVMQPDITMKELRETASDYGIKNYSRISKDRLLVLIGNIRSKQ